MDVKTYTFYAPCPVLDIERMQTWLEDMAMEGYLLKGCGKIRRKFEFYKIEPLHTRYRLTPVSSKMEEWNLRPDEEFVSITDAYGWEYVCSHYQLHIFRTYDEEAREIHSDPAIQAQAIRQLGWRIVKMALVWVLLPLIYLMIILTFGGVNNFWQSLIIDSAGIQFDLAYIVLFAMVKATVELAQLFPLYRKLKQGYAATQRKEWKRKAPAHRAGLRAYPIILFALATLMLMGRAAYRSSVDFQDLPEVATGLPFMSIADMARDSNVRSAERMEDVGYMRNWAHILTPVNYDWAEIVEVVGSDGTEGLVSMELYYHEARYPWLSDALAREYMAKAQQVGSPMDQAPRTDADQAYFYYNEYGKPAAVLQYGNVVMDVNFPRADIDEPALQFEYWIETMDGLLSTN